jgi:hypothetical protein
LILKSGLRFYSDVVEENLKFWVKNYSILYGGIVIGYLRIVVGKVLGYVCSCIKFSLQGYVGEVAQSLSTVYLRERFGYTEFLDEKRWNDEDFKVFQAFVRHHKPQPIEFLSLMVHDSLIIHEYVIVDEGSCEQENRNCFEEGGDDCCPVQEEYMSEGFISKWFE